MTKFEVLCRTWTHDRDNFPFLCLNLNAVPAILPPKQFSRVRQMKRFHFLTDIFPAVAVGIVSGPFLNNSNLNCTKLFEISMKTTAKAKSWQLAVKTRHFIGWYKNDKLILTARRRD